MCDRPGCMHLPNFRTMDFSRRKVLKSAAATTLTMAVGGGLMGAAHAAANTLKSTHGTGFCNFNIFLSHALQTAKDDGVEIQFINTPTFAEQVTFLGIGQVDVGLMPYTSFMALFDAGAPVKVVAGGGIEGCVIVSQPGLDSPEKLKGMMKAQAMAETKPEETLTQLVGAYYKTSLENARIAMGKQPAVVDARSQTQFILDRTDSLVEMGYIKKKPGRDAIDWTLLEQVIAENKELYASLKYKSG